jgi:hypothetical protein
VICTESVALLLPAQSAAAISASQSVRTIVASRHSRRRKEGRLRGPLLIREKRK